MSPLVFELVLELVLASILGGMVKAVSISSMYSDIGTQEAEALDGKLEAQRCQCIKDQ